MKMYSIAEVLIGGEGLPKSFNPFEVYKKDKIECEIKKCNKDNFFGIEIAESYAQGWFNIYRGVKRDWIYKSNSCNVKLFISKNYSYMEFYIKEENNDNAQMQLLILLRIALECMFINKNIISLHSACINYKGKAIAFSGKSGIGKSTRASAWEKTFNAKWISGDRPLVMIKNNKAFTCGVPWDGKEKIYSNVIIPIEAILEVRRGEICFLRKLSVEQIRKFLIKQCFIPMWDTEISARAIRNVYNIADKVRVYRLFGGYDSIACYEIENILFNELKKTGEEAKDMRIKSGFRLSSAIGEYMVLPTGSNIKNFNGAVILNEVSAFIYEQLEKGICKEDLLKMILGEFDVDEEIAGRDLEMILDKFRDYGMLDEEN